MCVCVAFVVFVLFCTLQSVDKRPQLSPPSRDGIVAQGPVYLSLCKMFLAELGARGKVLSSPCRGRVLLFPAGLAAAALRPLL